MKSDALSSVAATTLLTTAKPTALDDAQTRAAKAESKHLAGMQEALAKLRAMPSPKVSRKRMATEQATMLKRRLEMMKQMLIGASPELAKTLAAQIKAIAKELAGLAKVLASDGSKTSAPTISVSGTPEVSAHGASSTAESSAPAAAEASGAVETTVAATVADTATPTNTTDSTNNDQENAVSPGQREGLAAYAAQNTQSSRDSSASNSNDEQEKAADKDLKKALAEALALLRELIAMLKSKAAASKKANEDIREADAQVRDIERSMAQAGSSLGGDFDVAFADGGNIAAISTDTGGGVDVAV